MERRHFMYYTRQGTIPDKPFTVLLGPNGEPTHEELVTSVGFSGPSSLVYRVRPSTEVDAIELIRDQPLVELENSSFRNHQIDADATELTGTFGSSRTPLFFNDDFVYSVSRPISHDGTFYRNALCDELLLVVRGAGRLTSAFGALAVGPLDLVYVPRGTTIAFEPASDDVFMVVVEGSTPITPPAQYLQQRGQLSYRGLYQERDLRLPVFEGPQASDHKSSVVVKLGTKYLRHTLPNHPFDAVGWDGTLYPFALNMESLSPVAGRVHTTPDIYSIFQCAGLYISAITPVRQPDHENSTSAQPDHSSDCDEIFHRFGRPGENGFAPGAVTLHGRIAPHGPSLALKMRERRERTVGWGLIIDVVRPAKVADTAAAGDHPGYHGASA